MLSDSQSLLSATGDKSNRTKNHAPEPSSSAAKKRTRSNADIRYHQLRAQKQLSAFQESKRKIETDDTHGFAETIHKTIEEGDQIVYDELKKTKSKLRGKIKLESTHRKAADDEVLRKANKASRRMVDQAELDQSVELEMMKADNDSKFEVM